MVLSVKKNAFGGRFFMELMFGIFPIFFIAIFIIVIGVFVVTIGKGIARWSKNNNSPVLTVDASVVTKRDAYRQYHHHGAGDVGMHHTTYSTTYYVTFQVQSGDRMELQVDENQYGLLVEGDFGKLTFQGTRFLDFKRG
jgi:hypothetical protein